MEDSTKKKDRLPNPRETANCLSALTFSWLLRLFIKGFKRDLDVNDLYQALKEHRSDYLGDKFEKVWQREVLNAKKYGRKPRFLCVIVRIFFWRNIIYSAILGITELGLRLSQPFFVGLLVQYFSSNNQIVPPPSGDDPTYVARFIEILTYQRSQIQRHEAVFYATGIVVISLICVFVVHPYTLAILHQGMKIRVACCALIYRKALRLSKAALRETTVGQIVNLLSNDVNRFDPSLIFLHYLWIGPLETIIVSYFMYQVFGWSMSLGVLFLLLLIPIQGFLGKQMSRYRLRTALKTDERVRLMNEILMGIQVIKMYTWEYSFAKMVAKIREKELKVIKVSAYDRGILLSFMIFSTRFSIFLTILGYALTEDSALTAQKIFILTSFYNILRQSMTVFFPAGIAQLAEALISVKRIQEFMMYEENPHSIKMTKEEAFHYSVAPHTGHLEQVIFENVTARWLRDQSEPTLSSINLKVIAGSLIAIIGPVGSGKTSFLQAILRELPEESGKLAVRGTISYAGQEPWLFVGTVRQNILFGAKYVKNRYRKVIKACSLNKDFELLPNGDKTIVGERGVSLSGGQRARINLARAVYREADIYLLDDPLSAVDIHVGKHLFDDCIAGFLKSKTVILVTHQLQYLSSVDHIIILSNGTIQAQGKFHDLQTSGLDFAKMLHETSTFIEPDEVKSDIMMSMKRKTSVGSLVSMASDEPGEVVHPSSELKISRKGRIKYYVEYLGGVQNWTLVFFMVLAFILCQVLSSFGDYWGGKWATDEEMNQNKTEKEREESRLMNIYVYSAVSVATMVVTLVRSFLFFYACILASKNLHDKMFSNIICAPLRFFFTNSSGRILNRFSKDMGSVDEILPSTMIDCVQIFLALLGIVIMVSVVNPLLLVPTLIIGVIFFFIRIFYIRTSRPVKGLEASTRTPVFSHLNATLQGLTTVRALNAQSILTKEFDSHQDLHSSAWYIFISTSRAFGFWLDNFCVLFIGIVTYTFLFFNFGTGSDAGLAITQSLALTGMLQWGMRQSAELENYMTSVERILQYTNLEKEPPFESKRGKKPPDHWPYRGEIRYEKVDVSYTPDGPPVLQGISLVIAPREKVGIVGRTGAGKSTLISALFRLAYIKGKIKIDSVDTSEIGLHDLRSKISIIPQEPVLFSGTLRYNLDPFDEYPDILLWQALEEVELKALVEENDGLNCKITEGGDNFSVGQRQLLCLARAIVRNNKILVMDEATANVDPHTDHLIQNTIRKKFVGCTVLTVAHRLNTIMDSNRILVLDGGEVAEFGYPYLMLQNPDGFLSRMVDETGLETSQELRSVAEKCHIERFGPLYETG